MPEPLNNAIPNVNTMTADRKMNNMIFFSLVSE